MNRRVPAVVLSLTIGLGVTACAGRVTDSRSSGQSATGTAGTPAPDSPGPGGSAGPCHSDTVTLTEADRGTTICVTVGTQIQVYLHGAPDSPWSAVTSTGGALRPAASGKRMLPQGVTAGYFEATGPGAATISSSRPACPSATVPGGVACGALLGFTVSVTVS